MWWQECIGTVGNSSNGWCQKKKPKPKHPNPQFIPSLNKHGLFPPCPHQGTTPKFSLCITYVSKDLIGNNHMANRKPESVGEVVLKYNPYRFLVWNPGFLHGSLILQFLQFYTCGGWEKHCHEILWVWKCVRSTEGMFCFLSLATPPFPVLTGQGGSSK